MWKIEKELAKSLGKSQGMDEDDISVLEFGFAVVKSTVISFCGVVLAGFLVGQLLGTLVISFTVAFLRSLTGGPHCSTEYRCAVTSGMVFGLLGLLSTWIWPFMNIGLMAVAGALLLFAILLWAPQDCPEKPIISSSHRRKLRALGLAALTGLLLIQYYLVTRQFLPFVTWIAEGMVWQAILLSPAGVWIIRQFDHGLERLAQFIFRKPSTTA